MTRGRALLGALVGLLSLGCLLGAHAASAKTVWLCQPGHRPDPCSVGLSTTVYSPTLKPLRVIHPRAARSPRIDCFYVYPTVSGQPTGNANLHVDPEEQSIALYQAARYSQYCRVFAPMYRQVTLAGIGLAKPTTAPSYPIAISDVRGAFQTYLHKYNHGRGFVLLGHSQGSFVLRVLMARDIDPKPAVRRRLLSAILLGGNVLVRRGSEIGGDFKHIPGCTRARQLGCVIAFSSFDQPVPSSSFFGRPLGAFAATTPDEVVLCTNPAALGGGSGILNPIGPSQPFYQGNPLAIAIKGLGVTEPMPSTVWWSQPGAYSARCSSADNANVLQIAPRGGAQGATPSPTAAWGLHLIDANIALGNLLTIVKSEAAAFAARGR